MFRKRSRQVATQQVPMAEAMVNILTRQHNELLEALRAQTAAIAQLAASNEELVVAIAQLALTVEDPEPDGGEGPVTHAGDTPDHAGMGDTVGGYVQRDSRVAQQTER